MVENKTMDAIHRNILKKFHTLCSVLGLTEAEKRAIVESYGAESSRDMDTHDLINVCGKLSQQVDARKGAGDMDKLRKRVMAAIGGYLKATHQASNAALIKGIACRATGHTDFNKIPRERLRNLVAAFNNKVKDTRAVNEITDGILLQAFSGYGNGTKAEA